MQIRPTSAQAVALGQTSSPGAASTDGLGYIPVEIPAGSQEIGPMRPGDQGISASERRHKNKLIQDTFKARGVQWVATYDAVDKVYEIIGRDGILRFKRLRAPNGELVFTIVEQRGKIIPGSGDGRAMRTIEGEYARSTGPGGAVRRDQQEYPDLLRRMAQLFDDPRAPDMVYIPFGDADNNHPHGGSHGVPSLTQSRAPLIMSGPGIARGGVDVLAQNEDIAPTIAHFLGVQPVRGKNGAGAARWQYMKWQDGKSQAQAVAQAHLGAQGTYGAAKRAMLFMIDGLSQTTLQEEMRKGNLPNIARVAKMGAAFQNGVLAEYPTVTWANHNTVVTGASPGHSGVVNNSWYNRAEGKEQLITDGSKLNAFRTGKLISPEVETLYEAVKRSFGPDAVTTAINQPSGRGATLSTLDLQGVPIFLRGIASIGAKVLDGLKSIADPSIKDKEYKGAAIQDNLASAIGSHMLSGKNPPKLQVFEFTVTDSMGHHHGPRHELTRAAVRETDRNIGRVLAELDKKGLTDSTMLVVSADHGMELQGPKEQTGGWHEALKASTVKNKESTRFIYMKNMNYSVHGTPPTKDSASTMQVLVTDDDLGPKGVKKVVEGAIVEFVDAAGKRYSATTGKDGVAKIDLPAGAQAPLRVRVAHDQFTEEQGTLRA